MRKRYLLPGPVLLGFCDFFDQAWGKPSAEPLPVLAPTTIGGVPLPFPCPHCGAVHPVLQDRKLMDKYRDPWRDFSWCPSCQGRYRLTRGASPPAPIPLGAAAAPTLAVVGGKACVIQPVQVGCDLDMLETN